MLQFHSIHIYPFLHSPSPSILLTFLQDEKEKSLTNRNQSEQPLSLSDKLIWQFCDIKQPNQWKDRDENKMNASNYSCIINAISSSKTGARTQSSLHPIHLKHWQTEAVTFDRHLISQCCHHRSQVTTHWRHLKDLRYLWWGDGPGNINFVSRKKKKKKKAGTLARHSWCYCGVMF